MLQGWFIVFVSFAYLCLLFAIAYYGDKRADEGRSLIGNPYIYALSIAVYCTSWTFYGSVGRAASEGISFLPIYLGPTLTFVLWWFVLPIPAGFDVAARHREAFAALFPDGPRKRNGQHEDDHASNRERGPGLEPRQSTDTPSRHQERGDHQRQQHQPARTVEM